MANVLITAGRSAAALDLARQFTAAGHKVFVAETTLLHVCRFSNAVKKSYIIKSPRHHPNQFIEDLLKIVQKEKIDLLIPIYEEALYLAGNAHCFPKSCQVFISPLELMEELHNKWLFIKKLESLGIETPQTYLLKNEEDSRQLDPNQNYALKAVYSRAGLQVKKLHSFENLKIDFKSGASWIAQEWLEGEKYCTYSVCRQGKVMAHANYPVGFTVNGKGCIIFTAIEHHKILAWVENLVKKINFTGQIAFDLVECEGKILPIECNPRATSGVHLFESGDCLDKAFFGNAETLLQPKQGIARQLGIAMLLYGWKKEAIEGNNWMLYLKSLTSIQDVVYNKKDPLPFLMEPAVFAGICWNSLKAKKNLSAYFMDDYEWNGPQIRQQGKEGELCAIV